MLENKKNTVNDVNIVNSAHLQDAEERSALVATHHSNHLTNNQKKLLRELFFVFSGTFPLRAIKTLVPFLATLALVRVGSGEENSEILAASNIINTLEDFTSVVFNGPLCFVTTVIGEAMSNRDYRTVGKEVQIAWSIALICAIPQFVTMHYVKSILQWKHIEQPNYVQSYSETFFHIYLYSVFLLSLSCVTDQAMQTTNRLYYPNIIHLVGLGVTAFLSFGLGLGKFGMPELGVVGIAWALLARAITNFIFLHGHLVWASQNNGYFAPFSIFKKQTEIWGSFKRQAMNGYGLFLVFASMFAATFLINLRVGNTMGQSALQAQLVINQYQNFMLLPSLGLAAAGQILIAKRLKGEEEYENVLSEQRNKEIYFLGNMASFFSAAIPILYGIFSLAAPRLLMRPYFNPDNADNIETVDILDQKKLLLISAGIILLKSIHMCIAQCLMGASKIGFPMLFGLASDWLAMALAWGVAKTVVELNLFVGLGEAIAFTFSVGYWIYSKKKFIVTEQSSESQATESDKPVVDLINQAEKKSCSASLIIACSEICKPKKKKIQDGPLLGNEARHGIPV